MASSMPKLRAKVAGMDNNKKEQAAERARTEAIAEKWRGRGTSGEEMAAKESRVKSNAKFDAIERGQAADEANAERYGRDAYKSHGFGQGNSEIPRETAVTTDYAKGGKLKTQKYQAGGTPRADMEPPRPRIRPEDLLDGKNSTAPRRVPRPKARPTRMGASPSGQDATRGMNPEDNYSSEDLQSLRGMKKGGKVRGAGIAKKGIRACKMC
jgi:hypothetical protein